MGSDNGRHVFFWKLSEDVVVIRKSPIRVVIDPLSSGSCQWSLCLAM